MQKNTRGVLGGGLIGLLVAGTLALPGILPAAIADDEPARTLLKSIDELFPPRITAETFVKPQWTIEPWVNQEILSQSTVKKVGYGRTTFVTIMKTPNGTISSDGLASSHIRYPGIVRNSEVGSFLMVVPHENGSLIISNEGSCVTVQYGIYC